jgi:hypothetical protein
MLFLLATWISFKPLALTDKPAPKMMALGARIASSGKGLDRVLMEDRQVVGRWVKSFVPKDTEDVLWISPDLISRWLGYLQNSENLSDAEVSQRFLDIRKKEASTLWFVVRLAALDKQDPLEMGTDETAVTTDLSPVAIKVTLTDIGGNRVALPAVMIRTLADAKSSEPDQLIGLPWYIFSDSFTSLLPAVPPLPPPFNTGSNEARCIFVKVALPDTILAARQVELRVLSRRKTRIARFDTIRGTSSQLKSQDADRDVQRGFGAG